MRPDVQPHQVLGDLAALHRGDRRQRQLPGEVARGVDVADVRQAVVVDHDVARTRRPRPRPPRARGARGSGSTRSRARRATPSTLRPSSHSTSTESSTRVDGLRPRALEQLDAAREELVLEHRGDLGVLHRQHLLARHDERHLRAERAEHVGELDAGDARADDAEVLGDLGRRVRLAGREDALAVDRRPVGDAGPRPGREHDEVGVELLAAGLGLGDRPRADPAGGPVPSMSRTPCDSSSVRTDVRRCASIDATRSRSASTSSRPSATSPIARARVSSESSPPVAIIAFDGMQSHRWAAPPMMSRSISVTSAPSVAATVAAVLPPGPPPMITRRTGIGPGYATRAWVTSSGCPSSVTTRSADAP